jgi:FemAB-related protein (PEP-CTERM system-associated)
VSPAGAAEGALWQRYVDGHPEATNYHRWGWKQVVENAFGWPTYYLMANCEGQIGGVLPLVWQKSFVFGSFLTSVPFFNAGGIIADHAEAEHALLQEAIALARRLKVQHLELRHRSERPLALPTRTNKLTVIRAVGPDAEKMFNALDKKVRTDIRKAIKSELVAEVGGAELVDEFYEIFAENMRDLGTPVYSPNFFREVFRAFPHDSFITLVRHHGRAVASSFLSGFRDTMEVPWSSSLRSYLPMKPNMLLYWKNLAFSGERGYTFFDFGRSSVGSGTHKFKLQWGSQEVPLYWNYWLPDGKEIPELNPHNPKYRLAIAAWQKLPLRLTKLLGPHIVKRLP